GLVLQVHVDHRLGGGNHGAVLDEVAKVGILFLADRRLQRDRLLGDLEDLADLRHRDVHALGDLFRGRFAAQLLHQLTGGANELVDGLDHVDRDTNGACLVRNGASNGLADPPRGVGRELVPATVFKFVHGLHEADVALLDQVQELQATVGVLLGDGYHQAQVGLDELALSLLGIHIALDHFALRPLQIGEAGAGLLFNALQVAADLADLSAELLLLLLVIGAQRVQLLLQVVGLAVEAAHLVHGLVDTFDQALTLGVGKAEVADDARDLHQFAAQGPTILPAFTRLLLGRRDRLQLLGELLRLLVVAGQLVNLAGDLLQPVLQDLVGDLLLIEDDHFLDGADTLLEILTEGDDFTDDDRSAGKRLQDAQLAAFNALGDLHLAFACKERNRAHLAQVHADGIVGLLQRAGSEIEFNFVAFLFLFELLLQGRRRQLRRTLEHVNPLRADGGQQVVEVVRRVDVVGDEVVDLVVGQVALLLPGVDQLLNVVVLIVQSQSGNTPMHAAPRKDAQWQIRNGGNSRKGNCWFQRNLEILAQPGRSAQH